MKIVLVGVDTDVKRKLADMAGMILENTPEGLCTMEFCDVLSISYMPKGDAVVIFREADFIKIDRNKFVYAEFR